MWTLYTDGKIATKLWTHWRLPVVNVQIFNFFTLSLQPTYLNKKRALPLFVNRWNANTHKTRVFSAFFVTNFIWSLIQDTVCYGIYTWRVYFKCHRDIPKGDCRLSFNLPLGSTWKKNIDLGYALLTWIIRTISQVGWDLWEVSRLWEQNLSTASLIVFLALLYV